MCEMFDIHNWFIGFARRHSPRQLNERKFQFICLVDSIHQFTHPRLLSHAVLFQHSLCGISHIHGISTLPHHVADSDSFLAFIVWTNTKGSFSNPVMLVRLWRRRRKDDGIAMWWQRVEWTVSSLLFSRQVCEWVTFINYRTIIGLHAFALLPMYAVGPLLMKRDWIDGPGIVDDAWTRKWSKYRF